MNIMFKEKNKKRCVSILVEKNDVWDKCERLDEWVVLPCASAEFISAFEDEIYQIAFDCGFVCPDVGNTKIDLFIDSDEFDSSQRPIKGFLNVTVYPLRLTNENIVEGFITAEDVQASATFYQNKSSNVDNERGYETEVIEI